MFKGRHWVENDRKHSKCSDGVLFRRHQRSSQQVLDKLEGSFHVWGQGKRHRETTIKEGG